MIAQPLLRLDIDLWSDESNDILQKVGIVTGFRNSIHSRETMARDESLSIWYEADIVAGLRFEFLKGFSLEAKYVAITSPNDAWDTINEVDLDFAYNDAGKWGFYDFGINPTALYVIEFDGSAGGDPKGQYLELGIEPGMTVIPSMSFPLHLSFPVKVGLSMDNYYVFLPFGTDKDSTFGFAKVGVTLFLPLTFIPPQYGKWGVSAGFDVIVLGDNMEHFAGRNMDYIGRCGIGVKF